MKWLSQGPQHTRTKAQEKARESHCHLSFNHFPLCADLGFIRGSRRHGVQRREFQPCSLPLQALGVLCPLESHPWSGPVWGWAWPQFLWESVGASQEEASPQHSQGGSGHGGNRGLGPLLGLGPCRACLLIALALASLLVSASFQHIPEPIHPLNCLKSIEHQLFARHLFHRGEQSKYRPAPMRFLFKIASGKSNTHTLCGISHNQGEVQLIWHG